MGIQIKKPASRDIPEIIGLMREFAEFEILSDCIEITAEKLNEVVFGKDAFVDGLIAVDEDSPIAYAIFFPFFSSFRGEKSVYLEDIFVTERYRTSGIGEKMLKEIARIGKEFGAVRMDFQVLNWNKSAIKFYKKHGAEFHKAERHFLFSKKAFEKLAAKK